VVAVVAAWNSYWHMVSVALRGHQDPFLAYSLPFSIDGMILVATLAVAEDKAHGRCARGWARFAFWLGASVSVAANIAFVVVHNGLDTLSIAASAWPPVALLVVVEIMAKPGKPNGKPVPEADPQVPTPLPPPAVQLPPSSEEETNTTESDDEWPTTIGELRPADAAAVVGLIRPAIEAATELGAHGQTLSRDTLSDRTAGGRLRHLQRPRLDPVEDRQGYVVARCGWAAGTARRPRAEQSNRGLGDGERAVRGELRPAAYRAGAGAILCHGVHTSIRLSLFGSQRRPKPPPSLVLHAWRPDDRDRDRSLLCVGDDVCCAAEVSGGLAIPDSEEPIGHSDHEFACCPMCAVEVDAMKIEYERGENLICPVCEAGQADQVAVGGVRIQLLVSPARYPLWSVSSAEPFPRAGAGLGRVGLVGTDQVAGVAVGGQVVQDRSEVVLVELARRGGQPQGVVDLVGAHDGGELDRTGHLRPHPGRADRGRLDEPRERALADIQEVGLGLRARPRAGRAWVVAAEMVGVVRVHDARGAGRGQRVAGDLRCAGRGHRDDDQLLADDAAPHAGVHVHPSAPAPPVSLTCLYECLSIRSPRFGPHLRDRSHASNTSDNPDWASGSPVADHAIPPGARTDPRGKGQAGRTVGST
jgi:hypothetical protein